MKKSDYECEFLERFKEIHGVRTDAELSKKLGRSPSSVHNWRKRGNIPIDECMEVVEQYDVSLDWLIYGKGDKYIGGGRIGGPGDLPENAPPYVPELTAAERGEIIRADFGGADVVSIPLYNVEGAAGSGRAFDDEEVQAHFYMQRNVVDSLGLPAEKAVGVRVRGDSMGDTLEDGDWVLVDLSQRDPKLEGVYLILMDNERRIKRMQRVAGGGWMLISDNPHYKPEIISPEEQRFVQVLGRCVMRLGQVL